MNAEELEMLEGMKAGVAIRLEGLEAKVRQYEIVVSRIIEIALAHCAEYPGIREVNTLEQLYAIDATMQGSSKALDDWAKVGKAKGITAKDFDRILGKSRS